MLPGWRRESVPVNGKLERVIYWDPLSELSASGSPDQATRRIVATKKSVSIEIGGLHICSGKQLAAFVDMVLSAYAECPGQGDPADAAHHSNVQRITAAASCNGLILQAKGVQGHSLVDIIALLRPLWSCWTDWERLHINRDVARRIEQGGLMLEDAAANGAKEVAQLADDGADDVSRAVDHWCAGLRAAAELFLRLSEADAPLAFQRLERANVAFKQRLKAVGAEAVAQELARVQTHLQDSAAWSSMLGGSTKG